jgi:serine/threonine-protein kinase
VRFEPPSQERKVGRYAIQGEIATGGMATVHFGRLLGPAGFTRSVAIKRLHPQYAKDPHFVSMFLDEARLASRILHPNVVPILDVVAEGGELFLVMEFVPGEALSKLFRKTPEGVPTSIAIAIGVGMLEGLHAAHEARAEDGKPLEIVHRDVSPQNLLIGSDGVARLIDFGVAKAVGNATMTRDGQIKGKVAYMAPEQIRAEPVDRRADIYAASVVLWELVTGKRFLDEAGSEAALVLATLTKEAAPPSSVRAEVPRELDAALLRGLARAPGDRYATAREMAQALEKVQAPAAARDVARWVEAKAGEALRLRVHQLSQFDLSVATELPGRPSPRLVSVSDATTALQGAPAASVAPASVAPAASASTALPAGDPARGHAGIDAAPSAAYTAPLAPGVRESAAPREPRARTGPFVVVAVAAAACIGFYASRWTAPAPAAAIATTSSSLAPPASPSDAPAATPSASAKPERAELDQATATASASGEPSAAPAAKPPSVRPVRAATPATPRVAPPARRDAAASSSCTPPYRITADGVREYKPECVR